MATPLSLVKERFESKEKLVAAVEKLATKELWVGRVNDVKGLKRASNKKLIRLHDLLEDAKKRFGNRDKLIQSIAELAQRPKDKDWVASLASRPLAQLLDMHRSFDRAAKARAKAGVPEKKPKKEKKPMVKKPSTKLAAPKVEAPKAETKPAEKKTEAKPKTEKAEKSKPSASKPAASKEPAAKKPAAKKSAKKEE
ncbi:MAG TPA: hypothetical protein VMS65_16800 [Polyangiaceae bacterium]|nr:hypothetical protein [Polyangiaceae bacterium]